MRNASVDFLPMDLAKPLDSLHAHSPPQNAERLFYIFCAMSLSGSLYSMTVSSIAIILGQRLAVQATANLSARHEQNVKELINKFNLVLILLLASLCGVVLGELPTSLCNPRP